MRVRKGSVYVMRPTMLDLFRPATMTNQPIPDGTLVRVIQLPSAPRPNTMGQAHVEDLSGNFLGMVSTKSLARE